MFSLKDTLASRQLPQGYNPSMGIVALCGRRPVSITHLRSSPCPENLFVHFKSLLPITDNINEYIGRQFIAMQRLFAESDIAVFRGNTEDLSGNLELQPLQNLNVGPCLRGQPTADHNALFSNRNNVGNNDLVVYIVLTLIRMAPAPANLAGCATHPDGQPGAAVVQVNADWVVAHEVAHVLNLTHVDVNVPTNSDFLMWRNINWTKVPPDISQFESDSMRNSVFTNFC
jgi:hypothetical protein